MKGFVISWFYPPINSSEGLVTFKLLNRSKISHDVFTQQGDTHWSYKKEHRLKSPHVNTIFGDSSNPDAWIQSCLDYFDEHHEEYDFIMSRAMPPESHVAALKIKAKYPHIKWIASFGDPLYNSPYDKIFEDHSDKLNYPVKTPKEYVLRYLKRPVKKALINHQSRGDRQRSKFLKDLEFKTLTKADKVIFNNPYQKDFMLEQHPNSKVSFAIIPHSFEKKFYDKPIEKKDSKGLFHIVHTGHLDYLRTPLPLLKAVARVQEKHPEIYSKIRLSFYGTFDNYSKVYILDHKLYDVVSINKPIDYFESLNIVQDSDLCLLIDANFSKKLPKNIYFAAKIVDYIGANTPIFAITNPEGISSDVIREVGFDQSSHSVDDIYMSLMAILDNKTRVHLGYTPENKDEYDAANVAKKYDKLLQELVPEK